jgi:hypothetical protein
LAAVAKQWTIPGSRRRRLGRSTVRDWEALYGAMGFEGLKPQPRADAGSSRAIPAPVVELLLVLRAERPRASVSSLIRALRLSGRVAPEVHLAPSTVYRLLAAHGLPPVASPAAEPDAQAFTYPHSGDLWTADVMHGPRLWVPGGATGPRPTSTPCSTTPHAWWPGPLSTRRTTPPASFDALKQALRRRRLARRLYCDNGPAFRTHHLEVVCATLNIALLHSRPHRPRKRGKIERFFRHVRTAFLPHLTADLLADLGSLNRVFGAWLEAEYHQTPHGGLDGQTPWERFEADRELLRPAPENLEALMRTRVLRKVARDRTVRLDGRLYETPDGWTGETVEVLYDPYDAKAPVHFRRRGEATEHRLRPLDLGLNATLRRLPPEPAPAPPMSATGIRCLDLLAKKFYGEAPEVKR